MEKYMGEHKVKNIKTIESIIRAMLLDTAKDPAYSGKKFRNAQILDESKELLWALTIELDASNPPTSLSKYIEKIPVGDPKLQTSYVGYIEDEPGEGFTVRATITLTCLKSTTKPVVIEGMSFWESIKYNLGIETPDRFKK